MFLKLSVNSIDHFSNIRFVERIPRYEHSNNNGTVQISIAHVATCYLRFIIVTAPFVKYCNKYVTNIYKLILSAV